MPFFEQDFVMRQIQQLTQVLQQVIFRKKQHQYEEAKKQIRDAFQSLTKDHPKEFHELSLEETLRLFRQEQTFRAELAIAAADLLVEEGNITAERKFSQSQQSYAQALLLYKRCLQDSDTPVPLNLHQQISDLKQVLAGSEKLPEIDHILSRQ